MVTCKNCRADNEDQDLFCHGCGRELKWSKINDLNSSKEKAKEQRHDTSKKLTKNEILIFTRLILNVLSFLLLLDYSNLFYSSSNSFIIACLLFIILPITVLVKVLFLFNIKIRI